ncbi:MAG: molybdopterin-binding protein [Candidatus Krumholzibacteriia bacterium]
MRKVAVEDAIGLALGHDITEIDPRRRIKRRAFRRGHVVAASDVERLRDLGKNAIYVWEDDSNLVHEDDAARLVAPLAAGEGVDHDSEPVEGKIGFRASRRGLFQVDVERLLELHRLQVPSLPTILTDSMVEKGQAVAAFRIIPLCCTRETMDAVRSLLATPLLRVKPFVIDTAAVVVTGDEVFHGRVEDGFVPRLTETLERHGVAVTAAEILPDDRAQIAAAVARHTAGCGLVLVTGGTSVDPDDVTHAALADAGVVFASRGGPLQPGNNLSIGTLGGARVITVPAAALFFRATALEVFLPRLLAGDPVTADDVARAGHGGLCQFCATCHFPVCTFGAGGRVR